MPFDYDYPAADAIQQLLDQQDELEEAIEVLERVIDIAIARLQEHLP